jgi:uncharacterized OsmC-like protein
MMQNAMAAISYEGDLRTAAQHIASGTVIHTDAPIDNKGKGQSFSPTDLLCVSWASCQLTIMGIKAEEAGLEVPSIKVKVYKTMANKPRRIGAIAMEIDMRGKYYSPEEKQLLESAAHGCPVCRSLSPDIQLKTHWIWAS